MSHYEHVIKNTSDLIPYISNSRTHSQEQVIQIAASIKEFGFTNPVLIDEDGGIIAGHGRIQAAQLIEIEEVPCIVLDGLSEAQKKAYIIADNQLPLNAGWDLDLLKLEVEGLKELDFDIELLGFDDGFLKDLFNDNEDPYSDGVAGNMTAEFGQPPFSILDTRKADWLERKRMWRDLINDEGESREGVLGNYDSLNTGGRKMPTVSLLDPVMAELMVKWFGFSGGMAFDPFAGDTVFGFVAGSCGMGFNGIELRSEQAELNQSRCDKAGLPCKYFTDSSENMDKYIDDESIDFVFSCPPYADLEVYSDDPRDLSNLSHDDFFKLYSSILANTYNKLKNNRFAVIVMGEVRGKDGSYIGTIPKTIQAMEKAGYKFYNEIVLINGAGTLPLRAGKSMRATRKIGKTHQNIMVFLKGDAGLAVDEIGDIDIPLDFEVEGDGE